ncbi:MAG: hypothetical protein LQ346_006037, partial [Caloplaca aetnensis]
MSSYDDDNSGNTGSRGDDSYGVGPSGPKASEADLTSALQGGRGGEESYGSTGRTGSSGNDDSYGVREPGQILGDDSYGSSGRTTGGDDSYGSGDRSGSSQLGSGITGGAGSGNKLTSGYQESGRLPEDYGTGHQGETTDRNEAYSGGHDEYGSGECTQPTFSLFPLVRLRLLTRCEGATGGVGFGNKTSDSVPSDSTYGGNPEVGRNSDPYTGSREYGSGATGGAGFGNKHSHREDSEDKPSDSTSGKIMEKVGGMFGNKDMEQKGAEKREQARYGDDSGSGG